jgi:hypothetical protein
MICFDCPDAPAAAVCMHCGAGVCLEHAVVQDEYLTVDAPINRSVPVDPPARRILCERCAAAETAQARGYTRTRREAKTRVNGPARRAAIHA